MFIDLNRRFMEWHGRDGELSNPDSLTPECMRIAPERVGAALVFGRKATIAIPDGEFVLSDSNKPLDLADVLPDLGADQRTRLLNRPVFDPATFGRARLAAFDPKPK